MKKTTKYVVYSMFILLFFVSCKINEWNSPWWDITLVAPLVNDTFAIIDLRSDENFEFDDYQVYFVTKDDIEEAEIRDGELKMSPSEGGIFYLRLPRFEDSLPIISDEDDVQIVHAIVSSGKLDFDFRSVSDNITYVTIVFNEILDLNNNQKRVRIQRQGSNFSYESSLVGYKFQNLVASDELIERLNFTVIIESTDGGATDGRMDIFYEDSIYFSSIYGILDNLRIDTEDIISNIDIEWPINIENAIRIKNPKMVINIYNYLNFPAIFNATVTAFNTRSNLQHTFDIEIYMEPTDNIDVAAKRVITIVPNNPSDLSFIVRPIDVMMNIAPDKIEVTNAHMMIVNPNKEKHHARVGRAFYGDLESTVPFDLVFLGEPVFPATPETVEISRNNRENIEKRVENAALRVVLANRYSLGGVMQLHFSYRDDHEFMYGDESESGRRLVIKEDRLARSLRVEKAPDINNPHEETYYVDLTREELKMFHLHEEIYFGFKIVFDEGETIVRPDETISIIARLIARVMVDFD